MFCGDLHRKTLWVDMDVERDAGGGGSDNTGPGSQETWNFEKYPDNPRGKWDVPAKQVTDVYHAQMHPIMKGCINFQMGKA